MSEHRVVLGASCTDDAILPPATELPPIRELPDPFLQPDGTRVASKQQWNRQRAHLQSLILGYEYGRIPLERGPVTALELSSEAHPHIPAVISHVQLRWGPSGQASLHVKATTPRKSARPFPAIISAYLYYGEDPAILAEIVRRGYMLVEFDRNEIAMDHPGAQSAMRAWYPQYDRGHLAAWAWGFQVVVDYLLTRQDVDPARIAVTGHSRCGKAALLAGAVDPRISLTCPNGSGCGGAGCYRFTPPGSEDMATILRVLPYWFSRRLKEFVGCVDRLPFDQHTLKALVAPRALLSTEALADLWANPEGTQHTYLAAREVFRWLGAADRIGIHYRQGGHDQNLDDWRALLDFADYVFFGKASGRCFNHLPFPTNRSLFPWSATDGVQT